jgi:hypothetical protein
MTRANALGGAYYRIAAERIADLRFKDVPGSLNPRQRSNHHFDGFSFPRGWGRFFDRQH